MTARDASTQRATVEKPCPRGAKGHTVRRALNRWVPVVLATIILPPPLFAERPGKLILAVERKPSAAVPRLRERRVLRLTPAARPPKLDGKLDDACWQNAPVTGDLLMGAGTEHPMPFPKKTALRLTYDDSNLYLAFECFDPEIDTLIAKHTARDDRYWLEDDIEFMIDPNYDRNGFYQFLFNAAGGQGDYACRVLGRRITADGKYNPAWWLKTRVSDDRWVGEIALPLRSLGVDRIVPGTRWGFNFCRMENPGSLMGNWTRATNHRDTRLFGDLVFGKAQFALGETDLGARARGVNLLRAAVANNTNAARSLSVAVLVSAGGRAVARTVAGTVIPPDRTQPLFLTYEVPLDAARARVELTLLDPQWDRTIVRREYDIQPKPILQARLDSIEYFEKDREARVHATIEVGDITAATGRLRAALFRQGEKVPLLEDIVAPIPTGARLLRLNVSGLGAGSYVLALAVVDPAGTVLAEERLAFSKSKSLLDF